MAALNTLCPEIRTGALSRFTNYFTEKSRTSRAIEKLKSRHQLYARVLEQYPDNVKQMHESGDIPMAMRLGGGILSVYPDALDFTIETGVAQFLDVRILGSVEADTRVATQAYDSSNPLHRRAARLANSAVREHLGALQHHY